MSNHGLLLFVVLVGVVAYLVWDTYYMGNLEKVKSSVDGNVYTVQSQADKEEAANLLAKIRKNLETMVAHLQKMYPDDPRTKQLVANFRPDRISEGSEKGKYTSYSVNKGEKIIFCLRSKDAQKKLVELNTMMFVALHELGHIATVSTGHTPEFWDNFRWLLDEAIQIGIYRKQDFKAKPEPYCGITITDSPLDKE